MSTSEPLKSLNPAAPMLASSVGVVEPQVIGGPRSAVRHEAGAVQVRGARRRPSGMSPASEGVRSRARLPEPRRDGAWTYLKQAALTSAPLMLVDLVALLVVVTLTAALGFQWLNPDDPTSRAIIWFPSIAFACVLLNSVLGLYPGVGLGTVDEIRRLFSSLTVVALITLARHNITTERFYERLPFLVVAYSLALFVAPVFRSIARKRLGATSWWGFPTLVCGDDSVAFSVDQWLQDNRRLGLQPLGVIADPQILELEHGAPRFLGNWTEARRIAEEKHAFWAVLVEPQETEQLQLGATPAIEQHLGNVPLVFIISKMTGIPDGWNRHQMDEALPGLLVEQHLLLPIPQLVKRGMDLTISSIACLFLAPLFLVLGAAIKLTTPGPVFYGHTRAGRGNTRFKAWKFRTMKANADKMLDDYLAKHPELREEWERDHKLKNDPRVTPLGKWMRKWSIDELPQVFNVLCGEMSVVGPRPIVEDEIGKYGEHFETFNSVLPGITGLWQVCGRNDTTYEERVQLDLYYVHHWSPWLDLYLLVRTVKTVLFTRGAY